MDGLAVELLEKIAAFACTDGGRTGRSLSLTSRYIRDTTRATRFHSVSLTKKSNDQISQFSSHFLAEQKALSDRTIPRIRHMCISPAKGAVEVCKLAAPGLHTLALIQLEEPQQSADDSDDIDVSGVDFPLLRELTILGVGSEFGVVTPLPKLLSLTRLHILPLPTKKLASAPDLRLWSLRAPGVTHLRVAFTDDTDVVLKAQIENVAAPELLGLPVMFSKLEETLIQPTCVQPELPGRLGRHVKIPQFKLKPSMIATRPLTILPVMTTKLQQLGLAVEDEWSSRMDGGPGCWVGK
ncbi:hypothetical protein LXA43DRAFT_1091216 [Ganoderma leucocontextum]|nr:hypothetical protein LXA43DRAFT_1091216 [Ganoderma leucocontextum]